MLQSLIQKIINSITWKRINGNSKCEIGRHGESIAAKFLKRTKKYKIIARNWRYKQNEIDIIARDGEVLVFVEVKTRTSDELTAGYYSVTSRKKRVLARGCKAYLKYMKPKPKYFRFDIVVVKFCKKEENIVKHYSNVALFSKNFHAQTNE